MTLALNSKNKLGFVNGSIKVPSEEIDPEGYATWSRVIYYTTAYEVWENLCERFSQSNAPRIFEIQRDIACLRQEQLCVSAYYTKLKSLWDELGSYSDSINGAQADSQKLMQFLMGLKETYSAVRGQILLMNPLPSVRQAYASIAQEEKQRALSATHTAAETDMSAAIAVRSSDKANTLEGVKRLNHPFQPQDVRSKRSYSLQGDRDRPHFSSGGDRRSSRPRPQCTYCVDMGHWVQKCFQLHGFPPGHPKSIQNLGPNRYKGAHAANQVSGEERSSVSLSESQLKQLLSLLNEKDGASSSQANAAVTKPGLSKVYSHRWIIDNGATDHIFSSQKSFLHKNKHCSLPPVLLPSGEKAKIIAKGSLPLNSTYARRAKIISLPPPKSLASPPPPTTASLPSPTASLPPPPPPPPPEPLSRSDRSHNPPVKLQDYVCSQVTRACSDQPDSLFPGPHNVEPYSYSEAVVHLEWQQAMSSELKALEDNGTWTRTPLPAGKTPFGCRWVYKLKHRSNGSIERYKAQLVAKGFTQLEGIDYQDTFSPTAKIISVRCILALAAAHGWLLHQLDVNNAFLHGDLHEEIYMSPLPGLRQQGEEHLVCRLHKSLYGLKQASWQWFTKFSDAIRSAGYAQPKADYSLFTRKQGKSFTVLLIYVDDILITGNDPTSIAKIKKFLHNNFRLKGLGNLKYFLGIELSASKRAIFISQRKYALEIIKDTGLLRAAPIDTPMKRSLKLSDKSDLLKDPGRYRRLVGRLIYLTVSRPDITYSVHVLSRFMHQPRKDHWEAALLIVRYLKSAPGQGLFFSSASDLRLRAFCNSDWAGCPLTRRSTTGYCVFLGSSLNSWRSKLQKTVSLSSAEAEYRAMTGACCELTLLRYLLKDLGVLHQEPALLHCDNKAALHIAANPVFHEHTRHIEMDYHYIRDKIQDGSVVTRFMKSTHQLADVLTKPLGKELFIPMVRKLGVQDIHSPT
ncbi:hypothetical protein ACOSP7_020574 [Xanthoceras sorbifolium]